MAGIQWKCYCSLTALTTCHVLFIAFEHYQNIIQEHVPVDTRSSIVRIVRQCDAAVRNRVDKIIASKATFKKDAFKQSIIPRSVQPNELLTFTLKAWQRLTLLARVFRSVDTGSP